jgi:hypothetical protein
MTQLALRRNRVYIGSCHTVISPWHGRVGRVRCDVLRPGDEPASAGNRALSGAKVIGEVGLLRDSEDSC